MAFDNAGFSEYIGSARLIQRGASVHSGPAAFKLKVSSGAFLTTARIGDRIVNYTDSTFATVTAVDSDTQLSISKDIFTGIDKGFDHIRPAYEKLHPGMGVESAISILVARGVDATVGGAFVAYTIDLYKIDPQTNSRVLVNRSDSKGVLTNIIEVAKADGGTGDTAVVPIVLLPTFFSIYQIENYRLERIPLTVEGMNKSMTTQ